MLVLRAFRDAGRVSAGSPPSHLQAERWLKRRCAFHPGFLLSFFLSGFPLGAGRKGSVVGGTQRAFSSRRTGAGSPGRAFALAAQKPGAGRGRWAGRRGAAGVSGRRAFPPPATPVSLWSGKKASHKTANKKRLSVAQTSPFRKNWLYARYKEESHFGRPYGPKGQRRPPHSALGGNLPKGGCNLWEPLAGDRRALSRDFPTNSGRGVSRNKSGFFTKMELTFTAEWL